MSTNTNASSYTLRWNGRKVKGAEGSYEQMRQLARRKIRKSLKNTEERRMAGYDRVSRNPTSITEFGFEIARAA